MASPTHLKPLAFTMGEPAGIGPELIARLWQDREKLGLEAFCYVGAPEAITAACPETPVKTISDAADTPNLFGRALPCLPVPIQTEIILGTPSPENGRAVIESIKLATELALSGAVSGIVTAPIHKAALYKSGFDAPGHTEFLARLSGEPDENAVMMLAAQGLRVVPVTIHIPIKAVPTALTASKIIHAGMVLHHDLKTRFGIENPRIAVAGLNPHAGENGTIGFEEATHLIPAIWALRDHGVDVTDPQPADTLFHVEARAKYDAVLCMYHDQALIPLKTLDFWGGVNITLGLPIIRTSPDHGTALELAGQGTARLDSMLAAIKMAQTMVQAEVSNHE